MFVACICGGTLEAALVMMGFGCLCKLFGRKGKCKCDHEEREANEERPSEERPDGRMDRRDKEDGNSSRKRSCCDLHDS